jgi:hypothetical protein
MAPLQTARHQHGVCVVGGSVFAIGGLRHGYEILASVEQFDPATNMWSYVAPMPTARSWLGVCVLDGHIYTIGGVAQVGGWCATLERYDPATDSWSNLADTTRQMHWPTAFVMNGRVHAMATDGDTTVEQYDPSTDSWSDAPMPALPGDIDCEYYAAFCVGGGGEVEVEEPPFSKYVPNVWSHTLRLRMRGQSAEWCAQQRVYE